MRSSAIVDEGQFEVFERENVRCGIEQGECLAARRRRLRSPRLRDNCWAAEEKLTARLILEASISAKAIALRLVNSSERTKPPTRRSPIIKKTRRCRRKEAIAAKKGGAQNRIVNENSAEAEQPQDRRRRGFHRHGADRGDEGDAIRIETRFIPNPVLQHQRQQKRNRSDPDPK